MWVTIVWIISITRRAKSFKSKSRSDSISFRYKKTELNTLTDILVDESLISKNSTGDVVVLGVTTDTVLNYTSTIFQNQQPNTYQQAALELAELVSETPKSDKVLKEYIGDTHQLKSTKLNDLFAQCESIGIVDSEELEKSDKVYFNGNLFRNEDIVRASAVLDSLKFDEKEMLKSIDTELSEHGCISLDKTHKMCNKELLDKVLSIGMYDLNKLCNDTENKFFLTKPGAFSKFGNPFKEDALDLAKVFVTALTYGMNFSPHGRDQIKNLPALMRALINGRSVGPTTAIGQDYRVLELRNVISLTPGGGGMYYMRLLKKDIGEIALAVLQQGDASERALTNIYSADVSSYEGPESNRQAVRRKNAKQSETSPLEFLRIMRA